jgi:hypothetical protein
MDELIMADTTIQYDAGTPTSMNDIPFGRLTTLPPPKITDEEKRLMHKLFCADSSHDLLHPNTPFEHWDVQYKNCLRMLFQDLDTLGILPSDNSEFKDEVTRRCQIVVEAATFGAAVAAAVAATIAGDDFAANANAAAFAAAGNAINYAAAANDTVNNNICPHPVRAETFPREYPDPDTPIVCQNVDNFTFPAIDVIITPARFYDACYRTGQADVFNKLIAWWQANVSRPGEAAGIYPHPFYINLVEQGITSIPDSYLFVAIQKINHGPDVSSNFFLVFVIKLGTIQKTIKFRLDRDNSCPEETDNGDYLIIGGKNLAKCFFKEIYTIINNSTTVDSLKEVRCLYKKSRSSEKHVKEKGTPQEGGVKQPKTPSSAPTPTKIKGSISKPAKPDTGPSIVDKSIIKSSPLYNNGHLFTLLNPAVTNRENIGNILIEAKLLGDFLVMATTPHYAVVGTTDFLLCADNNINDKRTLFAFTRGGMVNRILFTPRTVAAPVAAPAREAVAAPASSTKKGIAKKGIAKKVAKKTFVKVRSSVRPHSIKATQKIRDMLIIKRKNKQGGGGVISIAVTIANKELDMTPNEYTESKRAEAELAGTNEPSEKIKMYSYKGRQLIMDKTFKEQGVTEGSNIYKIITIQTEVTKTDNSFYSLITIESFKLMLKKFIDNLKGLVKISGGKYISRIQLEEVQEDSKIYTLNDTPNFAKRVTKIISFYEVIYGISNDSLFEALMKTNMFGVLELITPVSPFIPKEGESDSFVFLLCPNWFTYIRYAEQYLKKFLTSPDTMNIEIYLTDDKNLHTAFIKELNQTVAKEDPLHVVSSRVIPSMNNFEIYLKSIVCIIAPFVSNEEAFEEEFDCSVHEICNLLKISVEELGIKFTVEETHEQEEGENDEQEKYLKKKDLFNRISQILSSLIGANILTETMELELLKAIIKDSEKNSYLIKSIHMLLKKTVNYYGTFICIPEIIVAFIQGIDFQNNTLLFFGNFSQLYECINIYNDIEDEIKNDATYNNFEDLYLEEINSITNAVLELPEIASILDETQLDEKRVDELIESSVNKVMQELDQQIKELEQNEQQEQIRQPLDPMGLREVNETNQLRGEISVTGVGGKNNRISNPKHNTKYRKNYKKFVSKYIIKKKRDNKKNNNKKKNNKNKTKKNKRLTKSKPNSKRNNKTLKNKKGKSKSNKHKSNHKSKYNKKTKTSYYNFYKHNKTLKH